MKYRHGQHVRVTNIGGHTPRPGLRGVVLYAYYDTTLNEMGYHVRIRGLDGSPKEYGYAESELAPDFNGVEFILELL